MYLVLYDWIILLSDAERSRLAELQATSMALGICWSLVYIIFVAAFNLPEILFNSLTLATQ